MQEFHIVDTLCEIPFFVIGFLFSVVENRDFDLMCFGYGFGIYTKQE